MDELDGLGHGVGARLGGAQAKQVHTGPGRCTAQNAMLDHPEHQRCPASVPMAVAVQVLELECSAAFTDFVEHAVDMLCHRVSGAI